MPDDETPFVSPQVGRWVLVSTVLASSMAFIDSSALNLILPAIQRELGASGTQMLWVSNAYLLPLSALMLLGGSLGDVYGRKRLFAIGIAGFAVASAFCGLAPNPELLIAARTLQGVFGSMMVPGSLSMITTLFPHQRRGKAIGIWSALSTVTTIAGPLLGGFLASAGLWRGVFFINLPLAFVALMALTFRFPPGPYRDHGAQLDVPGALLITSGLAGMTYAFIEASNLGWSDPRIYGSLILSGLCLLAFLPIERVVSQPLVPLGLFQSNTFASTNLMTLLLYGGLIGGFFFYSLNLIQAQGYPERIAGVTLLPFSILLTLLSRFSGDYADRHGPRGPLILGPLLVALGFALLSFPGQTDGPVEYWRTYFPGMIVVGAGMGITVAPLSTAVMNSVPLRRSGTASGVNNAISRVGGVLSIAVMGALALTTFRSGLLMGTQDLDLGRALREELATEAGDLGEAQVPAQAPQELVAHLRHVLRASLINSFQLQVRLAAGLALLSSLAFFLWVQNPEVLPTEQEGFSA